MRSPTRKSRTARHRHCSRAPTSNKSVETLDAQRIKCAVVLDLDAQHHRPAAHLAVLDVLLRPAAHLDARIEALPAVRTARRYKLLRCDPGALRPGLVDGFQPIELIDLLCIGACQAPSQTLNSGILATSHGGHFILLPPPHRIETL